MYVFGSGGGGGGGAWVEREESDGRVCVLVGVGEDWVGALDQGLEWCYDCVGCDSGFSV